MNSSEIKTSDGFIRDLINGNLGLAKTFWVFHIIIGIGLQYILLGKNVVFNIIVLVYFTIVIVGVWRAANKYKGAKKYIIMAKSFIIIEALIVIYDGLIYLIINSHIRL